MNGMQALAKSEIRIMTELCDRAGGINLSQGVCDMPLPPGLKDQACAAIHAGQNHYTAHDGIPELKQAVANKLRYYNGIAADPNGGIVVTCGASGAFCSACMALLEPGSQMILFEPFYGYHLYTLQVLGIEPVLAELSPPDWTFDADKVENLVTPQTRAILVNTPVNPTGKVFTQEELERLADICIRHDLLVFTDEIYEYFVYDGKRHISPGSVPALRDRTVTISGFSKTFSITGWRIGYCSCAPELAKLVGYASDLVYVCAPAPMQAAVASVLPELPQIHYEQLRSQYQAKRDRMCEGLSLAGFSPHVPQGAYYILADASFVPGETSKEKAMRVLNTTGVAVVPGSAFCTEGRGETLVRVCFAKVDRVLDEACERLQRLKHH